MKDTDSRLDALERQVQDLQEQVRVLQEPQSGPRRDWSSTTPERNLAWCSGSMRCAA